MICDRVSCATIYMVLMQLYPSFSGAFVTCFFLDFGSHFLQFNSSALMKSDSHKGKNKKENFIVDFYYNKYWFFVMIVVCSELSTAFLVAMAQSKWAQESVVMHLITGFLCINLSTKMVINVFQWRGACERFMEFES